MGRPPCCDKVGIKKGPWTPEEDIILVSYIQEHGPGNWRAVPTNTGLMRCSKSCRLRWTNYLRPGIKRGNFTPHEEGMIIHLQALLGNKWAAIASYLPQRTDNDIKNYWNTHLKKKLNKIQSAGNASESTSYHQFTSKSYGESDPQAALRTSENIPSVYASSAENISRLLEGWMRSSSPVQQDNNNNTSGISTSRHVEKVEFNDASGSIQYYRPVAGQMDHDDELESILSFDHHNLNNNKKSSCDSSRTESSGLMDQDDEKVHFDEKIDNNNPPLSFLEKWLLDESACANQVELPPIF